MTNQSYAGLATSIASYQSNNQAALTSNATALSQTSSTLDSRLSGSVGVNMDSELAQLTALQNAYTANANVLTNFNTMFQALLTAVGA